MSSKTIRTALILLFVFSLLFVPRAQQATAPVAAAQEAAPADRIALHQALLDLTNPWTVMCIAAHPDDEDGTSLIVMRRKYGAHTVSLFSTFGEGGQNAIGPELYEEMGAIRARETMAAAEIQGSEPHFLGLKDFGYSKSADEAFKFWGHDEALRRMVLQIRQLRPDVIITNHSATSNDHGHHQATARLELEAFDAAADPKRFPEQLKDGVTTWQVQRLFVRARGNAAQADASPTVTIDPNERDPITGKMYAEQALEALQKHATQGPWPKTFADMLRFRNSQDGKLPVIRYRLTREAKGAEALTKDATNFLDGLRLPEKIAAEVKAPTINGLPISDPSIPSQQVTEALDREWQRVSIYAVKMMYGAEKYDERVSMLYFSHVVAATLRAYGVSTKLSGPNLLIPGQHAKFSFVITNKGAVNVIVKEGPELRESGGGITLPCCDDLKAGTVIPPGGSKTMELDYQVPPTTTITVPHSAHLYDEDPYGMGAGAFVSAEIGKSFKYVIGANSWFDVAPAVDIANISASPLIKTPAAIKPTRTGTADRIFNDFDFNVRLTNNQDSPFAGDIVTTQGVGRNGILRRITLAAHEKADITLRVPGSAQSTGLRKSESRTPEPLVISVIGSGATQPLARLEVPIVWADAQVTPNLRVGYVRGFDFSLPNALTALGVESKELSVDELKTADLQKYTSIIVDNRVYESQPELIAANQKLLDYANAGGNLIVFYHKSNEWNPDERRKRPQLAPYKLILGDERVTDETAPITFIEPEHPLLNWPNKMGQDDFANWIQERGLYYPREWDPQFHALLQSNDPGEAPLKGGLLVADYGRGHYIYTSMVWYRELRGGIPGAYRMLANMISYGRK